MSNFKRGKKPWRLRCCCGRRYCALASHTRRYNYHERKKFLIAENELREC